MAIALPVVNGADSLALVIEASTTLLALIEVRPSLSPVMEPAAMSAAITELFAIALVFILDNGIVVYLVCYCGVFNASICSCSLAICSSLVG